MCSHAEMRQRVIKCTGQFYLKMLIRSILPKWVLEEYRGTWKLVRSL